MQDIANLSMEHPEVYRTFVNLSMEHSERYRTFVILSMEHPQKALQHRGSKSGVEDSREAGKACIIVGRVGFSHARRASTTVGGLWKPICAVCQEQPAQTQENFSRSSCLHACMHASGKM